MASAFTAKGASNGTANLAIKKERIETLEALLETHEAIGAEPDSRDIQELKERLKVARMQLAAMR